MLVRFPDDRKLLTAKALTKQNILVSTIEMLDLAKRCNAPILQASASEIYSDPSVYPQVENFLDNVNPVRPRTYYDKDKRCTETLCIDYATQSAIAMQIPRIFNILGSRIHLNDGLVVLISSNKDSKEKIFKYMVMFLKNVHFVMPTIY